ncbi:MAG: FimB/Mfa2 family fimbrial subunit [Bacteroidales bacterium]|nr:FimB/Mfa2 family fimbrial subunit [Bacteroidales bacterium]
MKRINTIAWMAALLLGTFSFSACDRVIYDQEVSEDCAVAVRFRFDFNLKYADAFRNEVHSVALYVFDKSGRFVTKATESGVPLTREDYTLEIPGLKTGIYDVVAWCGLEDSDTFDVPDVTTKEELLCRIKTTVRTKAQETVSDKWLGSLFYGYVENADLVNLPRGSVNTIEIPLVKDTNSVTVLLQAITEGMDDVGTLTPEQFDFVIYDYNAELGWNNNIVNYAPLTYLPFNTKQGSITLNDGTEVLTAAVAEFSVSRLVKRTENNPRLIITQRSNGKVVFDIPIIDYFLMVKSYYVQSMEDQEYLDRQDDYSVAIFLEYKKGPGPGPDPEGYYVAASVYINGWHIVLMNTDL